MSDKPDSKRWSWISIGAIPIVLAVLYVLSVGPAYRIARANKSFRSYHAAYWPLMQMAAGSAEFRSVINAYLRLWE